MYLKASDGTLVPISPQQIKASSVWSRAFESSGSWKEARIGQFEIPELTGTEVEYLLSLLSSPSLANDLQAMRLSDLFYFREIAAKYLLENLLKTIDDNLPKILKKELPNVYLKIKGIPEDEFDRSVYEYVDRLIGFGIVDTKAIADWSGNLKWIHRTMEKDLKNLIERQSTATKDPNLGFHYPLYRSLVALEKDILPDYDGENLLKWLKDKYSLVYGYYQPWIDRSPAGLRNEIKDILEEYKGYTIESIVGDLEEYFHIKDIYPTLQLLNDYMYLMEYHSNREHGYPIPPKQEYFTQKDIDKVY